MQIDFSPQEADKFQEAIRQFDKANADDPNLETDGTALRPRELLYAERLNRWVLRLRPQASEALRLAARCQHIRRWEIPRGSFPMTRTGYLKWRESLKQRHAEISSAILREVGYPEEMIQRVRSLNLKQNIKQDEECQTLEDALCLVFIEHQLAALAGKTTEDKLITALQKSWTKMSPHGQQAALKLNLGERIKTLIQKALSAS